MTENSAAPLDSGKDLWQVYLLRCADGSYYCGVAKDARKRLSQHNGLIPGGARYTASRRPVVIIALARLSGRSNALRLEAAIKKLPRRKKIAALEEYGKCQDWK